MAILGGKNGGSAFVVFGRETTVCGCERVICYNEDSISLGMREGKLTVEGKGLNVTTFFGNEIKICGEIALLRFENEKGGGAR